MVINGYDRWIVVKYNSEYISLTSTGKIRATSDDRLIIILAAWYHGMPIWLIADEVAKAIFPEEEHKCPNA